MAARSGRRRMPFALAAASLATGALVSGQAVYATRRRDLPRVDGFDASGTEGDPSRPEVRLACGGDSTLTGPGLDDASDIWIRQAVRRVAHDRHVVIHSSAVGGARAADVLHLQLGDLLEAEPQIAVIAVGSNDAIHLTPLDDVERSFRSLVATLVDHVPEVIIGGVGDLGASARLLPPLSAFVTARGRQVNRVIRRSVEAHERVRYIDVSTADSAFRSAGKSAFCADLFHPNRNGHAIWAGVAAPVIAHALRAVPVNPR